MNVWYQAAFPSAISSHSLFSSCRNSRGVQAFEWLMSISCWISDNSLCEQKRVRFSSLPAVSFHPGDPPLMYRSSSSLIYFLSHTSTATDLLIMIASVSQVRNCSNIHRDDHPFGDYITWENCAAISLQIPVALLIIIFYHAPAFPARCGRGACRWQSGSRSPRWSGDLKGGAIRVEWEDGNPAPGRKRCQSVKRQQFTRINHGMRKSVD